MNYQLKMSAEDEEAKRLAEKKAKKLEKKRLKALKYAFVAI